MQSIGLPDTRFHDLRYTYATTALRNGNNIKSIQESLGHATATFTLDIYAGVTDQMRRESSERMDAYIKALKMA